WGGRAQHRVERRGGEGERRARLALPAPPERSHRSPQAALGEDQVDFLVLAGARERERPRADAGEPRSPAPEDGVLPGEEELARRREADLHAAPQSMARRAGRHRPGGTAPPPAPRPRHHAAPPPPRP